MGKSSGGWEGLKAQLLGKAGIAWTTSHQHLMVQRRMQVETLGVSEAVSVEKTGQAWLDHSNSF